MATGQPASLRRRPAAARVLQPCAFDRRCAASRHRESPPGPEPHASSKTTDKLIRTGRQAGQAARYSHLHTPSTGHLIYIRKRQRRSVPPSAPCDALWSVSHKARCEKAQPGLPALPARARGEPLAPTTRTSHGGALPRRRSSRSRIRPRLPPALGRGAYYLRWPDWFCSAFRASAAACFWRRMSASAAMRFLGSPSFLPLACCFCLLRFFCLASSLWFPLDMVRRWGK